MPVAARAALLQVLVHGEGFGLDLIERVRSRTNGAVVLHQGSIYPALRALEREGLVTSREGDPLPERGGRPRVYYKLTALGQDEALANRDAVIGLFGTLIPEVTR